MLREIGLAVVLLAASGCGDGDPDDPARNETMAAGPEELRVELGVPGGADGLDFQPLNEGDVLALQTFGQGGTHVLIGVRCDGCDNRAFVSAKLVNLTTGKVVSEPAPVRPQLLFCGATGACDLVPYLVHASGIAADEERDGLEVELEARVKSESGTEASAALKIVLSTALL